MNYDPAKVFELAITQGVFTNVFGGPILGNYDRPETMRLGGAAVPTAVPGHPETITFWDIQDGVMTQITAEQAIERVNELNVQLAALGAPTETPEQMFQDQVHVLDMMLGHGKFDPTPQVMVDDQTEVELVGTHHYGHVEF